VSSRKIGILGTGVYVPERVLTNKDLEDIVNTNNNWILERTGIAERRIAAPEENNVTMAVAAARQALEAAGIAPEDLSYIILGTNTPTHYRRGAPALTMPSTWPSAWWPRRASMPWS
jgi:3-oxoacyl-[acyl-carrier-protein] synthase-3